MKNSKVIPILSGISFVLAFLMAIVLFTGYGRFIISINSARSIFMIAGAIALFLNFTSFQQGKHSPLYSLIFWGACIVIFAGLVFRIIHWPFSNYILLGGIILLTVSFFIPSKRTNEKVKDEELLDNL